MSLLDGENGLPAHTHACGQILLGQIQTGPVLFDVVGQLHGAKVRYTEHFVKNYLHGLPVTDVEAYIGGELMDGFRKVYTTDSPCDGARPA